MKDLEVRTGARGKVAVHGGVGDLVAPPIVSVGNLEGVQLGTRHGSDVVQEGLGLGVTVERGSLRTPSRLRTGNVVTV